MLQKFNSIEKISGSLILPGDKSISHRAIIFSSLAEGTSIISNLSSAEDVNSTRKCFEQLGVDFELRNQKLLVKGKGYKKLKEPAESLNAGNSGTTARLISGVLINQNFESVITGDESLSKRPMQRIIDPLTRMNGKIHGSSKNTLPLNISPSGNICAVDYELPVASAQVKSAVLISGLHLDEVTTVIEKIPSRNHTEKMLGLNFVNRNGRIISSVSKKNYPVAREYFVPSDISTAAFFIVLTLLSKNSELIIKNISLNETRTGFLNTLIKMGGEINITNKDEMAGEEFGDLIVKSSRLSNIEIPDEIIPNIIDEIPILTIAGLCAEGKFEISNASELRGKESDRILSICENLKLNGINIIENENGFSFIGKQKIKSGNFRSFGDHRIAMAFSILSLLLADGGSVEGFDCVKISNPGFLDQLKNVVK